MALNPSIILAGQGFDAIGTLDRSRQAAEGQIGLNTQNALAALYRDQGAGIAAGDQGAINALAQFDPAAALGIQDARLGLDAKRQDMAFTSKKMAALDTATQREAEAYAKSISAEQAAAEAAQLEASVKQALMAPTPEAFDALMVQMGRPEMVGQFDNREMLGAQFMSVAEILKMNAGPEPLSPEGKLAADVRAGLVDPSAADGGKRDPAAELKISRLMEGGLDRQTAIGIVDGRLVTSRDPVTGNVVVVDVARAPRVGEAETPAQVTPPAAGLDFGAAYPDAPNAFGIEGAVRRFANNATDVVGAAPLFPETMAAQNDFAVLREKLINDIASGYGRQPPSWLLKNIEALTPEAGSVFTGPEEAQSKLRSIGRDLQSEREATVAQMATDMTPTRRQELEARLAAIDAGLNRVRGALQSFEGPALRPEVADRLKAYE